MSRRFWSGALVISLLVTSAAAFYVVTQVQNKEIVAMMPVETHSTPVPAPATVVVPAPASAASPSVSTVMTSASVSSPGTTANNKPSQSKAPMAVQKRNILFALPRPNAKSVAIVGDFNDWKEDVMVKKDKKWQRTVSLEPGSYKYMFVVDKKQIRDPNNKMSADGKSLITVKPLTADK